MQSTTDTGQDINNTDNPVITITSLTRRLAEVIVAENRLLEERRPAETKPLVEQKGRLSTAYAQEMERVRKNGGITAFGTAEQLRELKRQTANFQRLLEDHRRLVERGKTLTEGILKAIGDEVASRNRPSQAYGKNARPERPRNNQPTSLALNQMI